MLTNHLVLNLRSKGQSEDPTDPSTKTDMFFRSAYGQPEDPNNPQSIVNSILGNIGEPLRVGGNGNDDAVEADGEDIMELQPISGEDAVPEGLQGNSTEV